MDFMGLRSCMPREALRLPSPQPLQDQPRYRELQIQQWRLTCRNEELQLRTEELQRELKWGHKHFDRTSKKLHAQLKLA